MPMLNVSTDTVEELINLAREFHAQEQVSFPEDASNPSGDWAVQMLADHAGDATADAFVTSVNDLDEDQQQELVALLWLGRGDYTEAEWETALAEAREQWTPHTGQYLLAHPLLPVHFEDGLEALSY